MGFEPLHDEHESIKVRVEHTDDIQRILSALKDAGASSLSLDVRKPNLEAVFLKLTGEALREGSPRAFRSEPARHRRTSRRMPQDVSREKSAMFFTIAFPIILILVFGTIFRIRTT